jgi:hypothetical protein
MTEQRIVRTVIENIPKRIPGHPKTIGPTPLLQETGY